MRTLSGSPVTGFLIGSTATFMRFPICTLLLRPLNVETLATSIYAEASRGTYEDGAVAALAIVLVGLVPVIVLVRSARGQARVARRADASLALAPG